MQTATPTLEDWLVDPAIPEALHANLVIQTLWETGVRNLGMAAAQMQIWGGDGFIWAMHRLEMPECACAPCQAVQHFLRETPAAVLQAPGDPLQIEPTAFTPDWPRLHGGQTKLVCAKCGQEKPVTAFDIYAIRAGKKVTCTDCRAKRRQRELARVARPATPQPVLTQPQSTLPEPRLAIELVPRPCWYSNMRKAMTEWQWDTLRRQVYAEHDNRCAICDSPRGPGNWLHCHELWAYDDINHVQTLTGFTAICEWCHHVKHIGLAGILAREGKIDFERVVSHFCAVNDCDRDAFEAYRADAFALWTARNQHVWRTDLGEYAGMVKS